MVVPFEGKPGSEGFLPSRRVSRVVPGDPPVYRVVMFGVVPLAVRVVPVTACTMPTVVLTVKDTVALPVEPVVLVPVRNDPPVPAAHPEIQVVALTRCVEEELVARTLDAGAIGYLLKDSRPDALPKAIRDARVGTVRLHVSNFLSKLGAPNRATAVVLAMKHGLV